MIFAFNISGTLGFAVGAFGLAALIGGVVAVLRVNVSKTTIELYKQDNDALRARLKTEGEDKERIKSDLTAAQAALIEKEREAVVLRDMVTGTSAIDRLADNMAGHFAVTEALLRHAVGEDIWKDAIALRDQAREDERRRRGFPSEGATSNDH